MKFTSINYIAPAQCPYTIDGVKLIEMRKAALSPYAKSLGIAENQPKNDMVQQMIRALEANGAPYELTELKKKKASKKK